jgi:hypothetical protein
MKTIEIRILIGFLAVMVIGCCCLVFGFGPYIGLPKIPMFYSALYGEPRWIIAVAVMLAVPAAMAYVFVRYIVHIFGSSAAPFLPACSTHQKSLVWGGIIFVSMGSLFVWMLLLSVDFGN